MAQPEFALPPVDVIIAAYNEEASIGETLDSILASDYPRERLKVWIVSDASTDRTDAITASYDRARVTLIRQARRSGKVAAQETATRQSRGEIVISRMPAPVFDPKRSACLWAIFADPSVDRSSGEKRSAPPRAAAPAVNPSMALRGHVAALGKPDGGQWVGVEGGLYAIRRGLASFDFPPDYAEDYSTGCLVCERGYRNVYEPSAVMVERVSHGLKNGIFPEDPGDRARHPGFHRIWIPTESVPASDVLFSERVAPAAKVVGSFRARDPGVGDRPQP